MNAYDSYLVKHGVDGKREITSCKLNLISNPDLLNVICELKKYGYTKEFMPIIISNYMAYKLKGIIFDFNDMPKVALFIKSVLMCFGYNEEEVISYFNKNKRIIFSSYSDFVKRLEIFNHIGFMKEALFESYFLLTRDLDAGIGLTTAQLYAICMENHFESLSELKEIIGRTPENRLRELVRSHPLNSEVIKELNEEFVKTCNRLKFKSDMSRRLKNKNGGIN